MIVCDRCGAEFPPNEAGQVHGYTHLCEPCANLMCEKYRDFKRDLNLDIMPSVDLVTEPDHVVTGPPADDDEGDEPTDDNATPIEEEYDLPSDDDDGPVEDRSTWPAHEPDMGEPVGECQLCGETMGDEAGEQVTAHAACHDREQYESDRGYDDARNLNAADITAEIRRMS